MKKEGNNKLIPSFMLKHKVIEINASLNQGSTGRIAEEIGMEAISKGWECYVAHGARYVGKTSLKDILIGSLNDEQLHYCRSYLFDAQGKGSKRYTQHLVELLGQIQPDVVHLHNIHGYYINYPILFRFLSAQRIPIVWTLHDCWPFTGHCTFFDNIGCEKWETKCGNCPQKSSYPKALIDRSKTNFITKQKMFTSVPNMTIVPVSDWLHRLVARSFLSKYPIQTIHNGIDLNKYCPTDSDFRKRNDLEGKFLVLGVADGYGERKGLSDFNLLSEKLGSQVKIILVGLSETDKKKVSPFILGIERTVNQQELINIYSAADVFINPTYEDNFPTTNIEALACGTPVITYRTGGSPEAVDEKTGLVVDKGDIEGLIQAIETVKSKGKAFYEKACRERAEAKFNKYYCFANYVRLYEGLIGNNGTKLQPMEKQKGQLR